MKRRLNAKQQAVARSAAAALHTINQLQKQQQQQQHSDQEDNKVDAEEEEETPSNLKRKVTARRPTLGHVSKRRGSTRPPRLQAQGVIRDGNLNNPSNLQILGGIARGTRLVSPHQVYLRPMMGKVREAVFSTFTSLAIYNDNNKVRHLDLFAGSGSVGLESLSRGAHHCTFVDFSPDCCNAIQRNVQQCKFTDVTVICSDALELLQNPTKYIESLSHHETTKYHIVTICPPYEEVVYADLLEAVANSSLVMSDTIVLIEYPMELKCLPHVISRIDGGKLIGIRNRKYGRTVIAMYIVNPTGCLEGAESRPEEFIFL